MGGEEEEENVDVETDERKEKKEEKDEGKEICAEEEKKEAGKVEEESEIVVDDQEVVDEQVDATNDAETAAADQGDASFAHSECPSDIEQTTGFHHIEVPGLPEGVAVLRAPSSVDLGEMQEEEEERAE